MLAPLSVASAPDIARHYDELDFVYRHLWGERLHHGLWNDDRKLSIEEATRRLLELIVDPLSLAPGERVIDVGCGYGADVRWIAERTEAEVHGITLSAQQAKVANEHGAPPRGFARIHQGDWLNNDFEDDSFDAAVVIESLAHMQDKERFFHELARTLSPGGRAAIACWTSAPDCSPFESLILRRLCRDGRLASLGTLAEYVQLAENAGLRITGSQDLTSAVAPTWWIIGSRAVKSILCPRFLKAASLALLRRPGIVLAIPGMILAYRTQALRYGVVRLEK